MVKSTAASRMAKANANSSPHSSEEASQHGTPSTNVTAFSPETVATVDSQAGTQPKIKLTVVTDAPSTSAGVNANNSDDDEDVFLSQPARTPANSQLSPVAESFTPGSRFVSQAARASTVLNGYGRDGAFAVPSNGVPTPVASLVAESTPDRRASYVRGDGQRVSDSDVLISKVCPKDPDREDMYQISNRMETTFAQLRALEYDPRGPPPTLLDAIVFEEGQFTTDSQNTRALMISGVSTNISFGEIGSLFNANLHRSLNGISLFDLQSNGVIVVGFTDVRDTNMVHPVVQHFYPTWKIERISPRQFASMINQRPIPLEYISNYEGQLIATLFYDGNATQFVGEPVVALVKRTLGTFGYIKALHTLPTNGQQHVREFRVEYEDTRAAENAFMSLQRVVIEGMVLSVDYHQPDLIAHEVPPSQPAPQQEQLSLTGRSTVPTNEYERLQMDINMVERPDEYSPHGSANRRPYDLNGNHNQVVIDRIRAGLDVRTTIMLRNIPNKVDQKMLKEILDESSRGCYDFMYLRIDFANNCNVGYAFVNFVDALAIIPFARARSGQRWNRFSSDKVAEISYATIQGRDCLVQKFRNSSVMLEHPTFRPQLYYTGPGPDSGTEERFPGPDNVSKMRRSVENAEHVGLFRPSPQSSMQQQRMGTRGWYDLPARAQTQTVIQPQSPTPLLTTTQPRPLSTPQSSIPPFNSARAPVIYTPASTPGSTTAGVDTSRRDDPFAGTPTMGDGISTLTPEHFRLFAPRQGQAYREEQRRRRSQFDRGTPGAEFEASSYRLTDPALSPVHEAYNTYVPNRPGTIGFTYGFDADLRHIRQTASALYRH